ncbi:MAG TPA: aldehyde dehydrogenase family protein, partial [Candidatus Polarisedimenticolaceae bacterium]|nr:aldehyde dehydrogenase family protein [Candidatus Polarisedimenticolaceae bacterium]
MAAANAPVPTGPQPAGRATPHREVDAVLARLEQRKHDWTRVPADRRAVLLRTCMHGLLDVADEWVRVATEAKGEPPASPVAGEEWISGPMVTLRYLRLLADALDRDGQPAAAEIRPGPAGRTVARVFPYDLFDRLLYAGLRAEVWIAPDRLPTQGRIYADKRAGRPGPGRVGLVLGAGNVGSIVPTDALYKMFVEDQVVLVKMNPINAYLGPLLRRAFRCLVDGGFLEFVYGDAEIGGYLCRHERVEAVHLTGSDATYDTIVWGATARERAARKAAGTPLVDKPFTAELGCVSPVIVAPGRWSANEIDFQARHVAAMVAHNASFNCNAAKVLVLPARWTQRGDFLDAVARALALTPPRRAYYPGAERRYRAFLDRYPRAVAVGARGEGVVPWTLVRDVEPTDDEYAFETEAFCGVLAEVTLDAGRTGDPATFLDGAARFVNRALRGSLSCTVLVSDAAREVMGASLERSIAALQYGGIGVNVWAGVLFGLGVTSWGANPGHTRADIGSGVG